MSDLNAMADTLTASGDFRVLRRLTHRDEITRPDGSAVRIGLLVDVETTGLDFESSEIIELAMVPFTYGPDGRIFKVHTAFQQFNEPTTPVPEQITQLTGITDAMVAGQRIDPRAVRAFANDASLVIAHNAGFDRRFLERLSEVFISKPWACSMSQVDWANEGYEGTKLAYLVAGAGFFYDRHRAMHDCRATIELLSAPLPKTGHLAMRRLLETARRSSWRIWAENSPFDLRHILKARGYRWNGYNNANPRAWYIDVETNERESEMAFLRNEVYLRDVQLSIHEITAYNRFSDRV